MRANNYLAKLKCPGSRKSVFVEISACTLREAVDEAASVAEGLEDYPGAEVVACGRVRTKSGKAEGDALP